MQSCLWAKFLSPLNRRNCDDEVLMMKTVLLVEDNQDDIFVMKMACQRTGIPHLLRVVTDGAMAIDYLSGNGDYADRLVNPLPDVVFLDIRMPKCDGHEVLKWIRSRPG